MFRKVLEPYIVAIDPGELCLLPHCMDEGTEAQDSTTVATLYQF